MEDSSHELIDQLIAEEKYCYGFENVSIENAAKDNNRLPMETAVYNSVESNAQERGEKRVSSVSSQSLLSHNKKWSVEEDDLLIHYVKLYGYGKWKVISEQIKTRNALQCKNRARQKKELQQFITSNKKQNTEETSTQANLIPIPSLLEPEINQEHPHTTLMAQENKTFKALTGDYPAPMNPIIEVPTRQWTELHIPSSEEKSIPIDKAIQEEQITGEAEETEVNLDDVTEEEKAANMEWFMGKPVKSPERYMRIRNHIIKCWKMTKPTYLTKTAGRKNLQDCGDVNAVGRIHAYLENIGAINVNCSAPAIIKKRPRKTSSENSESRKTKKGPGYYWADVDSDEDDIHEKHPRKNIIVGDGKSRPKRRANKRETFYDENRIDYGMSDDPFRLIPVVYYPKQYNAPFTVQVTSDVLLVMEFHSHLAYTEIIGLLGGKVVNDEGGRKILQVEYVFPCRSTSTGIQCEMDPVSEMAARELFEQKGLQVVGWYHSHPTFDPEPSIRDIENQSSYQDLFRDEISGVEPFIGIIITPYSSGDISDKSQFQFIHISNRWSSNHQYRLPFACIQNISQCEKVSPDVLQIFQDLLFQYRSYEHKIDMKLSYGSMTRLEKLMRSLKNHLFMGVEENKKFLIQVNHMIQTIYIGEPIQTGYNNDFSHIVDSLAI